MVGLDIWEERLVELMKQGSHEAFERCYRLISSNIYTVIYKVCRNEATAQELLQDTFLDIFQNIHSYKSNQSFVAWAKRIAFNNTLNAIKKRNRIELVADMPELTCELECNLTKQLIDSQLIESLLENVSEIERLVLWLFVVEQYNHEEIAALVSKTSSYSKSIISRTLKRIRLSQEATDYAYK